MSTQPHFITLNLRESSNASCFERNNCIHYKELDKVKSLIKDRLEKLEKLNQNDNVVQQDAFTILGSRGSGKTSFLKTLQHELGEMDKEMGKDNIWVIDIIDPTMIEQKGHVFLTIISQIRKIVDKKLDSECAQLPCQRRAWDDCLRRLAAGLPTLDGISDGANMEAWQDPEYIMNRGLERVDSAINLADNFRKLIQKALQIVDKKVLVLLLDDIDIDFCIGWPVLETVRKYLIFPEIITIVSGDMKLFTKAIRKKQWKNFGKALLMNEGEQLGRIDSYNDLVTKMESQYLQKVLKPQLRQRLMTLFEKYQVEPKLSIIVNNKELRDLYKEILNSYGIINGVQLEFYRSFLLNLPLRTQIQFLVKFNDLKIGEEYPDNIFDVFLSDLYEKEIDIDLAVSMPKYLYPITLKALVESEKLYDVYQLQPITLDDSLNGSLMALTLVASTQARMNPFLIFDYFIRINYIRNLGSAFENEVSRSNEPVSGRSERRRRVEMQATSIEGFIAHAALYQDRNLRDTMCMATAYLRAAMNAQLGKESFIPYGGTVCLYGTADKARKSTKEIGYRIDELQWVALIPASIAQSNAKDGSLLTYSVYVLLGTIAELLRICQVGQENNESAESEQTPIISDQAKLEKKQKLEKALGEMSQLRSFPMPGMMPYGGTSITEDADSKNDSLKDIYREEETVSVWAERILTWADQYPKQPISPHLLGKISTRAFYAMDSIDKSTAPRNLGEYMHQHLIAFMNAVLIENVRENVADLKLSNDNPRGKNRLFIENLKKVNESDYKDSDNLGLSRWILSCPLLLAFLEDDKQLIDALKNFGIRDIDSFISLKSIFLELSTVRIKGGRTSPDKHTETGKRPFFGCSKVELQRRTVDVFKAHNVSYEDLTGEDPKDIVSKYKGLFRNHQQVKPDGIEKIRAYILKNNITW